MGGCAGVVVIPPNVKPKSGLKRKLTESHDQGMTKIKSKILHLKFAQS